jgi:hypothetical protein
MYWPGLTTSTDSLGYSKIQILYFWAISGLRRQKRLETTLQNYLFFPAFLGVVE